MYTYCFVFLFASPRSQLDVCFNTSYALSPLTKLKLYTLFIQEIQLTRLFDYVLYLHTLHILEDICRIFTNVKEIFSFTCKQYRYSVLKKKCSFVIITLIRCISSKTEFYLNYYRYTTSINKIKSHFPGLKSSFRCTRNSL